MVLQQHRDILELTKHLHLKNVRIMHLVVLRLLSSFNATQLRQSNNKSL